MTTATDLAAALKAKLADAYGNASMSNRGASRAKEDLDAAEKIRLQLVAAMGRVEVPAPSPTGSIEPREYGFAIVGSPAAVYRQGDGPLIYTESEVTGLEGTYEATPLPYKLTAYETTGAPLWEPSKFTDELLFAYDAEKMNGDPVTYRPSGLWGKTHLSEAAGKAPVLANGLLTFTKNQYLLQEGTTQGATLFRGFMGSVVVSDLSGKGQAHIYTANAAGGPYDTPCIRYEAGKLVVRWDAEEYDGKTATGIKSMAVECDGFSADGKTLNRFVTGRHDGYLFIHLNGKFVQGPAIPWTGNNNTQGKTIIGPRADQGDTVGISIKYLAGLQGELSESFYRKAEEWLAGKKPVYEAGPHVPKFDKAAWDKWVAENPRNAAKYREHTGKPALPLTGYTRVYKEDFRANTVGAGGKVNTFAPTIYAQGANPAVGGDGATKNPFLDDLPSPTYQWEPGSLTLLNEYRDGKWRAGALTSVSNSMHGRSFAGGYVFRTRCTYTPEIDGKLFYGEWGYGIDFRLYHHIPRFEIDFNEPDAENRMWANYFSVHNHKPFIGGADMGHHKIVGTSLTKANGWPVDLDHFAGKPITREVRVDPDFVYLNIDLTSPSDMSDRTNLKEWLRFPTPPGALERWYFMLNTCIKTHKTEPWEPDRTKQYWLKVHGIEVYQRDEVVNALPDAFAERPRLMRSGDVVEVSAGLREPLAFIEYVWVAEDGYQLGVTRTPSFPSAGVSKCLVRAIGATDMPEAWTNTL